MNVTNCDVLSQIHCGYERVDSENPKPEEFESGKRKRRVRFPDDDLISDYLEPFRPVPDNCTSEQLIAAYLESCYQYKVQPIDFLLEQLKGIDLSICNERYSRLSLKGIRLNRLQVETLEEIFRRVHFRKLDFEGAYLNEQSAIAFFDMLLHYETCSELSVTLNLDKTHPSQAWMRCIAFLRRSGELRKFALSHTPLSIGNFLGLSFFGLCLECLSLRDCSLSGQALFGLVRWLQLLLSSTSLEPPIRDKSTGGTRGLKRLGYSGRGCRHARRVLPVQSSLQQPPVWALKLDVAFNKLNASDAETLLLLIRHQLLVPQIVESNSASLSTKISDDSIRADANTTEPRTPPPELLPIGGIGFLADLDISNNSLGDDGLRVLFTGLLQCYRSRLRRVHAVSETVTGQEVNADTLVSCSSSSIPTTAAPTTKEIVIRVRGLERLSVANNGLTASGMQIVSLVLMQTPLSLVSLVGGLVSLDLSYNPGISDTGIEILCNGLIRNHSLEELYLKSIQMSFCGIFALSGFLTESKCLKLLDIRGNHIDLASLMALSKTVALNHVLTSLFSDARSLASSDNPLIATDVELILFLVDEIDSCLRRNRLSTVEMSASTTPSTIARFSDEDLPSSTCPIGTEPAEVRSEVVVSEVTDEVDQWAQPLSQTSDIANQNALSSGGSPCEVCEVRSTCEHQPPILRVSPSHPYEEVVDSSVSRSEDDHLVEDNVCPLGLRLDSVVHTKDTTGVSVFGDQKSRGLINVSVTALECAATNVEDEPVGLCVRSSDDTDSLVSHTYSSNHHDSMTSSGSISFSVGLSLQDAESIRPKTDTLSDTSLKSPDHIVTIQNVDTMDQRDNVLQSQTTSSNNCVLVTADPNESPAMEEVKKNRKRRSKLKQNSQRGFDLHR
ncbi:protein phosphatase 1 regulatory subunit 37 [Paragonimus westermani]|uniref:Protein phosphatase 1 regulatory subunit 37 n=1 Tax=Paragonimus westermani TaxID=34504 RepID=A0A5J4ND97_9TREM|nr:protein phosphatase 1 regulatory subunit 37 [Paragonimus westermani]